jgi:large subunit ribosomal protein L23
MKKSPYAVIKSQYITEKTSVLQNLQTAEANKSVRKCTSPKYTFLVDKRATKGEIRDAVMEIYSAKQITVKAVNTIIMKPKKRRVRGRIGFKPSFKKAVVTLAPGDNIDEGV